MQLRIPDPGYTSSPRAKTSFVLAVKLALGFVALIWLVFGIQTVVGPEMTRFGLRPRELDGLWGLVTTPLLHGSLSHIMSNTLPLFVGGVALLFLYPNSSLRVLPMIYLGSAALAWTFARPSVHIGASGLVYGILTYVFVAGILRRDLRSVGVSLMIWFFYGSMLWGVFPLMPRMSWELHASGMILGLLLAWVFRAWDRPPVKTYDWEFEDEDSDRSWAESEPEQAARRDRDWPGLH
ncbi:MAG: rhomboid family intramembrane serine protease [Wenzhouxiangella sp.]|jgi:membrane associated rhomboid family serine protease|nr:rhomboid family intramembrane serine protease [Wenzhouxiangella sp.]